MYRLMIMLRYKPEEYHVKIYVYNGVGKLVDTREYNGVKQVILKTKEVLVSRQLSLEPFTIVTCAEKPRIDFRENSLLYVLDEGSD